LILQANASSSGVGISPSPRGVRGLGTQHWKALLYTKEAIYESWKCGVSFLDTVGTRQSIYLGSHRKREGLNRSDGYIVTSHRVRMLMSSDPGFRGEKRGLQLSRVYDYCDIRRSAISTDASLRG